MFKPLRSLNPYTGALIAEFAQTTEAELETALSSAVEAFGHYRQTKLEERSVLLRNLSSVLRERSVELAQTAVSEMGKSITAARAEVEKCAAASAYFAEKLPIYLKNITIQERPKRQFVTPLPLGTILAIMPWNFPYWQAFRAAIPALGAGNVMVLKHASNVSKSALLIADVFEQAGFPNGAFQTLLIDSSRIEKIIADPRVMAVTLTGSEGAGRSVAQAAGKNLKKCVLELGGSDPFIIMPSADLTKTSKAAATARTMNNGQSCIAAKRFIVHEQIFEEFVQKFTREMTSLTLGDPQKDETTIGPLVHTEAGRALAEQVTKALQAGAKLLCGTGRVGDNNLFAPTALLVPPAAPGERAPIFYEEFFGPVALVYACGSIEEAVQIANDSSFGLGSSIWTHDAQEKAYAIDRLEAGQTFINLVVASEAALPFGGIKASGYGRELGSLGIHEFVNQKSVSEEV